MTVLFLDPSSTRTGFALMDGADASRINEAGYLKPKTQRWPPIRRIDAMVADLQALLYENRVDRVVVEVSSGKVGRRHQGGGAGLPIYGQAVGEVRRTAIFIMGPDAVEAVPENQWTRSQSKADRLDRLRYMCPAYAAASRQDGGGDVGDAIMMGVWWFETLPYRQAGVDLPGKEAR